MKLGRGLAVVSLITAALPLAMACGSASNDLFSESGGSTQTAGGSSAHAGSASAGSNAQSGAPGAGAPTTTGGSNGEAGESSGGSSAGESANGGSEPEGGAPSGGTAGAAAGMGGSVGGASGGSAGAAAGMGGSSGAAAGSGGASGGSAGSGGASACPPAAPKDELACTVSTPDSCFYTGNACSCLPNNGPGPGGNKRWDCYGTPDNCPPVKPTVGLACKQYLGAECPFPGEQYCACVGNVNNATWQCHSAAAVCSQTKPTEGQVCGTVRTCSYAGVACFCNGSSWHCLGN